MSAKRIKIEDSCRDQVRSYLEVSKQTPKIFCEKITVRTGARITPPTVYSWLNGKSSIKLSTLEIIVDQMYHQGYEFTI